MKWLLVCLAVLFVVAQAMAGEDAYIAIVGNDTSGNTFYFGQKYQPFLYDQTEFGVPVCSGAFPPTNSYTRADASGVVPGPGCEQFRSQTSANQQEICDVTGKEGLKNAKTPAGNAGFYEWWIRLPMKPSGEINIVIQCGVVKPGGFSAYRYNAVRWCAAETGERIGSGTCVRQPVDAGVSPVNNAALPKLKAIAYPGDYNSFTPFNLTAFKNPSAYTLIFDPVTQSMSNNGNSQVLDGGSNAKILLKTCMDKSIVTKLPVSGQLNALGQEEADLEAGDFIYIRMDVPRQNTVDIYCHAQSARLQGVGESSF